MTETDNEQLLHLDQYLLRGIHKDFSRKLYDLSGDSLKEVQSTADLGFGDLAVKHGKLYVIVESHRLLVSDLRSGEQIREIIVPFEEELEGITLRGDGVFVWTSSEFYLLDESENDHIKVGEFRCPVKPKSEGPSESSLNEDETDSQPTNTEISRGLYTATVVRYDAEQKEFEAIIHYDGPDGEWRLLCKNGSQVDHEMIADNPWEFVGVRNDLVWLLKSREDERRVVAQRNGDVVHEINYSHMAALWQGVMNDDGLLYLRYCDSECNDFLDVIDTTEDGVKHLRTFALGCEPGCAFFVPVISRVPTA